MTSLARLTPGEKLEVVSTIRPSSLFDFVDNRFNGLETLRRLLGQARAHGVQTIIVERLKPSIELTEENEDLRTLVKHDFRSRAYRLGLFSKSISQARRIQDLTDKDFIGYIIVKRDVLPEKRLNPCHIYESVIKRSRHEHNYVRGEHEWPCLVGDKTFKVKGYLYAQQNGLTNVCSHAALRTVASRFESGRDLSYRKINQILGIDHVTKFGKGLISEQIIEVLKSVGIRVWEGRFKEGESKFDDITPFQRVLYSGIESGFPAIVFFKTNRDNEYHVVPVFGHTFNQDTWVPSAERIYFDAPQDQPCIFSDSWLSMFIGHDDNVGSNLCIPKHYLQTKGRRSPPENQSSRHEAEKAEMNSVVYVISTFPKGTELYFAKAEAAACYALSEILGRLPQRTSPWVRRMIDFEQKQQLVARPLLISREQYVEHLGKVRDWNHNAVFPEALSRFSDHLGAGPLWMIEFSIPDLFSNVKRKVAEVLVRADKPVKRAEDLADRISARLPGYFAFSTPGTADGVSAEFEFLVSGLEKHVELYGCEDEG